MAGITSSTANTKLAATLEKLIFGHRVAHRGRVRAADRCAAPRRGARPAHRRLVHQAAAAQARVHADLREAPERVRRRQPRADRAGRARRQHVHSRPSSTRSRKPPTKCWSWTASIAARVQSLFTPNVRYMEVVEDGIEAGNVVDSEFVPTPEALAKVRENILKAGIRGRLVANDFSGALVSAIVLEKDATGKPIDPIEVARALESRVRDKIQDNDVLVQAQGTRRRRAHDRFRQGGGRHRRRRHVGHRVRGGHDPAHAAGRLVLRAVAEGRAWCPSSAPSWRWSGSSARWCCSVTASIRWACWCRS